MNDRTVLRASEIAADDAAMALYIKVARLPNQPVRSWERACARANVPATLARLRVLYRGFQLAISCVKNGARDGGLGSDAFVIASYERKLANLAAQAQCVKDIQPLKRQPTFGAR